MPPPTENLSPQYAMHATEIRLWQQFRGGSREAFEQLTQFFYRDLHFYGSRFAHPPMKNYEAYTIDELLTDDWFLAWANYDQPDARLFRQEFGQKYPDRRTYGLPVNTPSAVDFTLTGQTAASFRELVMTERAYEFMMEASRWYDLKRLGTARLKAIIKEARSRDVADAHLLWPIPKQEIDNNPDINQADQNPSY